MADNDDPIRRTINVQLNPDGVAAPAQVAASICREVVDLYFGALSSADLSKPPPTPISNVIFRFGFKGMEMSASDRRSLHEAWVLSKVFQELVRAIRASLEEAYFFAELLATGRMKAKSSASLDQILAPYRKKAQDMNFPTLLAAVNKRLERPLEFADAYQSMQSARNCFEHRSGIVGRSDAGASGIMELHFPRPKIFIVREGEEIEVYQDMPVAAGEEILLKMERRIRRFEIGERLKITAADFEEIAYACSQFASELAQRLPKNTNK
jgi:hypothetical protein